MSDGICVYCNENGVCNNREAPQVYSACSKHTAFGTGSCMFYTPGPSNAVCAHKKDELISTAYPEATHSMGNSKLLCPTCSEKYNKLMQKFFGDWRDFDRQDVNRNY